MAKIKQLVWLNPKEDTWLTDDSIPQIIYRIYLSWDTLANARTYECRFQHGYARDYEVNLVCREPSVEECKKWAQKHFEQYVTENFLENENA